MSRAICRIVVLLACAASLAACYGPKPVVQRQELRPPAGPDAPYTLVVTIENQNAGEGQAEITARLIAKPSGATAAQASETIELQAHETMQVVLELRPAAAGDYDASAEVQYPPE
jgi:hypothetical protein